MDLADLVDPAHTALCVVECQNGVVGPASSVPAVAAAVADADLLARLGTLAAVARSVGVRVVHCTFRSRSDLWGGNRNSRLFAAARKSDVQQIEGTAAVEPAAELGFDADVDVVVSRSHGMSAASGTQLIPLLRNESVATVVVVGVSLNVAVPNTVFDLVNAGFQVVVPTDGAVATDADYGNQVLEHTLAHVSTLTDGATLAGVWQR